MRNNKKRSDKRKKNDMNNNILLYVFIFIVVYTFTEVIMEFMGMKLGMESPNNSALTSEVFSFAKLMLVSGAAITVKDKVKK